MYIIQYGFRTGHSTELAALELIDKLSKSIDSNEIPINIYLDLSKAFDTLDHNILLEKLHYYGIHGKALKLCTSYLLNREQFVEITNIKSDTLRIYSGVPQGSILGPLLFALYINDFTLATKKFCMINYADDTTLHSTYSTFTQQRDINLDDAINRELDNISKWIIANKLSINVGKSKFMIFHTPQRKNVYIPNLMLNNFPIELVNNFNFLGIRIDKHLNWNEHMNFLIQKISKVTGIINKLKNLLPRSVLKILYNTLIMPHLSYGILCWGSKAHLINITQKRTIRSICNVKFNAHTSPLFKSSYLLKIEDIHKLSQLKFYYRLKHNMLPTYFLNDYLYYNREVHEYGTRQSSFLRVPSHSHALFQNCLRYLIVSTINTCPYIILEKVNTHSLFGFGSFSKKYMIDNYEEQCRIPHCYICQSS